MLSLSLKLKILKAFKAVTKLGESPYTDDGEIKGKDTDSYIQHVCIVILFSLGLFTLSGTKKTKSFLHIIIAYLNALS